MWKNTSNHWSKTSKREEVLAKIQKYLRSDNWTGKHRDKKTLRKLNEGHKKWIREHPKEWEKSRFRASRWMIKEGNPNWKGGISPGYKEGNRLDNMGWRKIRKKLLEKCNYKCSKCGNKIKLVSHHLENWHINHNDNLDNLTVLCRGCHLKEHKVGKYRTYR